jgi:uncharacterized membrane protein
LLPLKEGVKEMTIIKKSTFINAPLEKVHDCAANPYNFALYMDGISDPEDIKGNGEAGTTGKFKALMLGKQYSIDVKIIESTLNEDGCVTVGEISGGFSGKQTATGKRRDNGTEVTYELEYTVPGSIFGKIADKLIVERKEEESMEKTLENLRALCEKK